MMKWLRKRFQAKAAIGEPSPVINELYYGDDGMAFHCTSCKNPVGLLLEWVDSTVGQNVACESCGHLFHVPGEVRKHEGKTECRHDIGVVAGVRVPIDQFPDWYFNHPTVKKLIESGHGDLHLHYGLFAFCSGCKHEYSHNILSTFALGRQASRFVFNASSEASANDMNSLMASKCPQCSESALLAIVTDVPDYVRQELKKMGH